MTTHRAIQLTDVNPLDTLLDESSRLQKQVADYKAAAEVEANLGNEARDEIVRLYQENERLRALLRRVEWVKFQNYHICPFCRRSYFHAPDCEWVKEMGNTSNNQI